MAELGSQTYGNTVVASGHVFLGTNNSHGYIKRDFDVDQWAAPEFLEKAATEVLKEEWEKRSWSKLPKGGGLDVEGTRLG